MAYKEKLERLIKDRGYPLRVGLVGAGQMGSGLVSLVEKMYGIRIVAIADIEKDRAMSAFIKAGVAEEQIVEESNPDIASQHITSGKRVISKHGQLITEIPNIEVVVEATGVPEQGAITCKTAIQNKKHIVNMNVESDVVIGYYLSKIARESGVIYTLITGDEPGAIKELFDFGNTLGFEIVCIGKGKNNILDVNATPDSVVEIAKKKKMNPKMLTSFIDGTKTMAELTSISNGTGYKPDIRGCHGPELKVGDLSKVFVPKEDGGILQERYVVDYATGTDVAPGVFIIITTDHSGIQEDLRYLNAKFGHGNYWTIYRPYHLCNLEAPISILRAFFYHEETLATREKPVAELISVAKRNLTKGDTIDGLGGFKVYGTIENSEKARHENIVPLSLAAGAKVVRNVPMGQPISYDDVVLDAGQTIYELRSLQDDLLGYK